MLKILKYSFFDLMRSRWAYIYTAFFLLLTVSLLWLSGDIAKVVASLMNVILVLAPLIATMFGVMYYYNSREFTELLLSQPIRRRHIFFGQYLGLALSLSLSLLLGVGLPFVVYGVWGSAEVWDFMMLLVVGVFLSFIFSALSFFIALRNENRIKGFGLAILVWLFFAVIYDGLFLLALSLFSDYPLENFAIGASLFNPIDLSRVLILLKLDISALMGYTGAVIQKFLGTALGMAVSMAALSVWVLLPAWGIQHVAKHKDF
ncbi:MAG: ABC-2 transporter permease [Phaeodactylibacter sp.]|nr:ABC-2 transporter permease [Phaeodactylibacter sp.]MCB9272423.1 ABC-2 transporter permease [Lewinellaceae bacterium]